MPLSSRECWRKITHCAAGVAVAVLVWLGLVTTERLLILLPMAIALSILAKGNYVPLITPLLDWMERPADRETFPGKAVIAIIVSLFFLTLWFPRPIVLASLMVFTFGDSLGHVVGATIGRIPSPIDRRKMLEGIAVAFLGSALAARLFVSWPAALAGSAFGLLVEQLPHDRIWWVERSAADNFTVPIAAAAAMAVTLLFV